MTVTDPTSQTSLLSPRHAIGAAAGLVVIMTTYGASGYGEGDRWWAALLTLVLAIGGADVLATLRRLLPLPGVVPATLLVVLAVMYLCVPETDHVEIAALLPLLVIGFEVIGRSQAGVEWYGVAAAGVLWAGMLGATGRQSALVGALFAWWPLVLVVLVGMVGLVRPIRTPLATGAVLAIGAVAAAAVARTGGIAESGAAAAGAAVGAAVVSFGLAVLAVKLLDATGAGAEPGDDDLSATP